MAHWTSSNWTQLISDHEAGVVTKEQLGGYCDQSEDERELKQVSIALAHLSKNKCSHARKVFCSFGLSDVSVTCLPHLSAPPNSTRSM
eukprot:250028-Ditylum_brightwellii.AAC.2